MSPSKELERNMENTEITLNGTDWSNLYIVDYAGGCGGEVMCDLISDKVDAQFSIPKSSTLYQSNAIDSFSNLYVTPSLSQVSTDITQYSGYKCKETVTHTHSEDTIKYNLKVNLIHREEDMSQKMESSTEDERDLLIHSSHFDKNYVLRSHREIDWSSFTNAKVIRMYPWIDSHLTYSLMMLKRWVEPGPPVHYFKKFMTSDMIEWITSNIFCKTPYTLYEWQCDLIMANSLQDFNWETFVVDKFEEAGDYKKNGCDVISAAKWVFGDSDSTYLDDIENITGVKIIKNDVVAWQQANRDLLAEHGLSMTSTKEECITYFKNYWILNNIPCVTEI